MAAVTQKTLSQELNVTDIIEAARGAWERQQRRRQTVTQWITRLLPFSLVVVFMVFYLLSAPHTVDVLNKITPQWGWLAPIGFELLIFIVAAFREKGWQGALTFIILWTLVFASIIINVSGALLVIIQSGEDQTLIGLTPQAILDKLGTLPATLQIPILMALIIGPLIPVIGKFSGQAIIKISMGKIRLETTDLQTQWLLERQEILRSALLVAAMQHGAGQATAGAWATKTIEQMYPEDAALTDGRGRSVPVPMMTRGMVTAHREMGFATERQLSHLSGADLNISNVNHSEPSQAINGTNDGHDGVTDVTIRRKDVKRWMKDNPQWVNMKASQISMAITGDLRGLRTVQRTIKEVSNKQEE